jgi:hypothetical protein
MMMEFSVHLIQQRMITSKQCVKHGLFPRHSLSIQRGAAYATHRCCKKLTGGDVAGRSVGPACRCGVAIQSRKRRGPEPSRPGSSAIDCEMIRFGSLCGRRTEATRRLRTPRRGVHPWTGGPGSARR